MLPLIDEDFCLFLIGDEERGTLDRFFVADEWSPWDETDDKESLSKFFSVFLFVFIGTSSKSSDSSIWRGEEGEGFVDELFCKSTNGFDNKRDDDVDDNSSRSCSCSDKDGMEFDEAMDDERGWCLEESIWKRIDQVI